MIVSLTRLRLRSFRFLIGFIIHTTRSERQARSSPGCLHVLARKTRGLTFWTISVWEDEASLRGFLSKGAHRKAMMKLPSWCDEASVARWVAESKQAPTWDGTELRMREHGRVLRVRFPSERQRDGTIHVD